MPSKPSKQKIESDDSPDYTGKKKGFISRLMYSKEQFDDVENPPQLTNLSLKSDAMPFGENSESSSNLESISLSNGSHENDKFSTPKVENKQEELMDKMLKKKMNLRDMKIYDSI